MDVCKEKHKQIDKQFDINGRRLNNHSERLDTIERDIVAQKKDTTHLQDAIKALKDSIDKLIDEIGQLKAKPLEKYEKVAMVVIVAVVGYLVGKWF